MAFAPGEPGRLQSEDLNRVYADSHGTLWVSAVSTGLYRLDDPAAGRFTLFAPDLANPDRLPGSQTGAIVQDPAGGAPWLGFSAQGLVRFDPAKGRCQRFPHDPRDPRGFGAASVERLTFDRAGTLWVGCFTAGLNKYSPGRHEFNPLLPPGHARTDEEVVAAAACFLRAGRDGGRLWIGTRAGGLGEWDVAAGRLVALHRHDPADPASLPHNPVASVYEDRAGFLWVGSAAHGLARVR